EADAPMIFLFEPHRVWRYDPAKNHWTPGASAGEYGLIQGAALGDDGEIRVYTCTHYDVYDPSSNVWAPGMQLLTDRCNPVTVAVNAGFYVRGGESSGNRGRGGGARCGADG